MKKTLLAFAGFTLAISLMWTGFALAANVRSGDSPRVMPNEVVGGTLYTAGTTVKVEGQVKGDMLCAGQQVEISGVVEGDVLCAAQNITVTGHVQGSVRVVAQTAAFSGKIDGSLSAMGQNIDVKTAATIGRDMTIVGQQTTLGGKVGRDAQVMGEAFEATGAVARDLDVTAPVVTLSSGAAIAGNFTYVSVNDASIATDARVAGRTTHSIPTAAPVDDSPRAYITTMLISLGGLIILGVALSFAAPRFMRVTSDTLATSPFMSLAVGLVVLVLPPVVAMMLAFTLVGMPLAAVIVLGWLLSLFCGLIVSAQAIGHIIVTKMGWRHTWNHIFAVVLGLFIISLAALIPYVGQLAAFTAVVWGAGAQWQAAITHRTLGLTKKGSKA